MLMAWLILVICRFRLALMKHPGFMWYEPVYLSYKLIRICSSCRNHNPVLSSFCFYHRVCQMCNTTGSHMWSSFPVFSGVPVSRSLVLCVMFCRSLLVLLAIVLSILLLFTVSDYPFGIFQYSCWNVYIKIKQIDV